SPTTTLPTWNTFANTTSTFPRSYAPNMLTLVSHGSTTSSSTSASDSSPASICTPSLRVKKTGRKRSLLDGGVQLEQLLVGLALQQVQRTHLAAIKAGAEAHQQLPQYPPQPLVGLAIHLDPPAIGQ